MDLSNSVIQVLIECEECSGTGNLMVVDTSGSLVSNPCNNCNGDGEIIIDLTLKELKGILSEIE